MTVYQRKLVGPGVAATSIRLKTAATFDRPTRRAVLIDLNNFATFPTMAIGVLVASLRRARFDVQVVVPLSHDVPATERERQETLRDHLARRIHLSTRTSFLASRDAARRLRRWWNNRPHPRVIREAARALDQQPDILLLSAYLQHYPSVLEIGKLAASRGVPLILGGPMFNVRETAMAWRRIPGLTAIVGGEVDLTLPALAETVLSGGDLLQFDGITLPDGRCSGLSPPLRDLDSVPVPDFTDFPWERYRLKVVPVITGRGCQWNKCAFCSDVISAGGRTYRTRSIDSVMDELETQSTRLSTSNFVFLDLKLNSSPAMFRAIAERIQTRVPGANWIGTVHVDQRADNGLSPEELQAAAASGMRRISFGLESGSQRLLDSMDKGCTTEANSKFIHDAANAGISVRCTMFKGFPGETAEDLLKTARFLEQHSNHLDRIRFNDFSLMYNTPIHEALKADNAVDSGLRVLEWNARDAKGRYVNAATTNKQYRRAKARVLRAVYAINQRPLRAGAEAFDGLM